MPATPAAAHLIDSGTAWRRLLVTLALMTVGAAGMYIVPVVLPAVQADFGVARADASLPYTLLMVGFGLGGMLMGRLADRFGVALPLSVGAVGMGLGFAAAALSGNIWLFALAHGVLIGLLGSSATFSPLLADTSLWFVRRRGIAVAVCASGNYLGGALWPPIIQHFVEAVGWRQTYWGLAVFCSLAMAGLAQLMRQRPPALALAPVTVRGVAASNRPFNLTLSQAQALLCVAGLSCCVAMSMPLKCCR
jgi:MFS family permease